MNSAAVAGGTQAGLRRWQLPADVSAFVGRAGELATLTAMLPGARLVTVAGPGGVGKTRLALRAAADATDDYPDGRCLVELSGSADEAGFYAAVAHGLGLRDRDDRSVLDYLAGQRLLLILDTCEHLSACCARFATRVLPAAAEVTILTTSRQPLHLADERVLRLGPLPVPAGDGDRVPGDAVELFATRAAAALPGFAVTAANLPDVIRLCRRLDGIPLAIELAAVRVRALPLAELTRHLESRFSLLTGGRRGTVPRHQTLRAAIEWSYHLCTDDERAVWDRLSVFAGSFSLAAARHVTACVQVPDGQVGDVLAGLVDKSVVWPVHDDTAGEAHGARYRLPDSAREYAAERLARGDQEAGCRQRHASWYLILAQDFGQHLAADEQPVRLARLRAEHANLRAALGYGFTDPGNDAGREGMRLASVLFPYWLMSGRLGEGLHWYDKTLARLGEPSPQRASALARCAMLGAMIGSQQAVTQAQEAVALAARAGDDRTRARGYLALQLALGFSGDYAQALETATRARRHLIALGADIALRCLDLQLALTYQLAGDLTAAVHLCKHAVAGLAPGERWLRGRAHIISTLVLYQQPGRQADCAQAAFEALGALRDLDDLMGEAYALEVLGWLAADEGRCERAAWLLGAAQSLWERTGGRLGGNAALEAHHGRSAGAAAGALGTAQYAELHARGAARPLGQIAALAVGGADVLPGVPEPEAARNNTAGSSVPEPDSDRPRVDGLTSRERQVAALVASGLSNREIAARLVISQRTVDAHVNHIFAKLSVSSRVQLTRRLSNRGAG